MLSRLCAFPLSLSRRTSFVIAALGLLALAAPGSAGSIATAEIRFDGASGFGVSQQTALASGAPILTRDSVALATDLETTRNVNEGSLVTGPPATVTSLWNVTNQTGQDLFGSLYLVFARPLPSTISVDGQPQDVTYLPEHVGLRLQSPWVIFEVDFDPNADPVYYPAVLLGSLGDGQTTADPFAVNYILDDPQIFLDADGFELGLPTWQILSVFIPIPEPSTVLLLGAGLAALGVRRRLRS